MQTNMMTKLRQALEASWDEKTSYLAALEPGNAALGQCYPTSRVVEYFFPKTKVVKGVVWNTEENEIHFWNVLEVDEELYHIDFTWQQFPEGSKVLSFELLDSKKYPDSDATIARCNLLKKRVKLYLENTKR